MTEDKLIDIIYDKIKDIDFYNDEELKDIELGTYTNILGNKVIKIKLSDRVYILECLKVYAEKEL